MQALQLMALALTAGIGLIVPGMWWMAIPLFIWTGFYVGYTSLIFLSLASFGSVSAYLDAVHAVECCGHPHPRLCRYPSGFDMVANYLTLILPLIIMLACLDQTTWAAVLLFFSAALTALRWAEFAYLYDRYAR